MSPLWEWIVLLSMVSVFGVFVAAVMLDDYLHYGRRNKRNRLYRLVDDANRRAIEKQARNVEPPKNVEELHALDDIEAEMNRSIERFRGGCDVWMTDPIEPLPADAEIPLPQALVGGGTSYGQPRGAPKAEPPFVSWTTPKPPFDPDYKLVGDTENAARKALAAWEAMKPARRPVMEKMSQPVESRIIDSNHVPIYRDDGTYVGMRHMTATEMTEARLARIPKERRELAGEAITLSVLSGFGAGDCLKMLNDGWHRAEERWSA